MARVHVMSGTLASQVAAGEVVERPASVVKELVENSLDAGAREIVVEIRKGGIAAIKVRDDGCGMTREDAVLSLERHASSKLTSVEQLDGILTLGFRGEAVPSIASVSRFRMLTREKGSDYGTEIAIEGGEVISVQDAGCAVGTEVEVRDLFFNVPARRKFLRTELTEGGHVEHEVRMHALASPGVRFVFRKDGRTVFDVPASRDARVRIGELDGREQMRHMQRVEWQERGVKVKGYALPAEGARKSRRGQAMFLNGRPVDDRVIWKAVADAYGERLGKGMCPVAWLWLELSPGLVDVNVHPAKREVRFHRPSDIRAALIEAVSAGLRGEARELVSTPKSEIGDKQLEEVEWVGRNPGSPDIVSPPVLKGDESGTQRGEPIPSPVLPKAEAFDITQQVPLGTVDKESESSREGAESFRVIGVLKSHQFILEGNDGLVLMDARNARERINYERLLNGQEQPASQGILVPIMLHLDARDAAIVFANRDNFSAAGMDVDEFGGNTVQVRSAPAFLAEGEVEGLILKLVDELVESEGTRAGHRVAFETFAAKFAKQSARGEQARLEAGQSVLKELFECDLPYCTADGRATLVHYSFNELARRFGRK